MIRLLYVSKARPDITEADVEAIVRHASKFNLSRNITGALAFNGTNFCQCLEGPAENVIRMLKVIRKDDRHSDMMITAKLDITTRYYEGWSMRWEFERSFSELREAMEEHPLPRHS